MKALQRLCAFLLCALLMLGMSSAALAAETNADPGDIAGEFKRLLNADGLMYQDIGPDAEGNYQMVVLYTGYNLSSHRVTVTILRTGEGFNAIEEELAAFTPDQLADVAIKINTIHLQYGHVLFTADVYRNTVDAGISGTLGGDAVVSARIVHEAVESLARITDTALPQLQFGQPGTPVTPTAPPAEINPAAPGVLPRNLTFGQYVTLGAWEQDNDLSNGPEPVEWRVLTVENGKALLITKKGIDVQVFNPQPASYTVWESCYLRSWLNEEFLENAFTAQERAAIQETLVPETVNEKYLTSSGNPTKDRIFILSVPEVEACFANELDRTAYPTDYSADKNGWPTVGYGVIWTRTPGEDQYHVALVGELGAINYEGWWVHNEDALVRPAMWVTLG